MKQISKKLRKTAIAAIIIAVFLSTQFMPIVGFLQISSAPKALAQETEVDPDYDAYQKYEQYLLYDKKNKFEKYEKYSKNKKKYGFSSSSAKAKAKAGYDKYRQFKKNPRAYPGYERLYDDYKAYSKYKKYVVPYKKYSRYAKYKKYDKKEYDAGKNFGGSAYKEGHERYQKSQSNGGLGEATLGGGPLGPEIAVGIFSFTKSELRDTHIDVLASKEYVVKNEAGTILGTFPGTTESRVGYISDGDLKVYESMAEINAGSDVYLEAADGNNTDMIFDLNRPSSSYDQFRGKIKVHFFDSSVADADRIWVINTLPMEHYVWGIGEITGTGDEEYNKTMTVMFRTYGYWKIRWSTQYVPQGFTVVNTSGNQIYEGYDHETECPRIKEAALDTAGKIMIYGDEIALSPYSSWTDGRTRSFEEHWGSTLYPWCRSVDDPYGKHPTMSTSELQAAGNHMVGLSAHGALKLATDYNWKWNKILSHYFYKVRFVKAY